MNMTDKEMNKLADIIVDKLLTTYIREQSMWYTTSTLDEIYGKFSPKKKRKTKRQNIEAELLGELAKLMTKLDYHTEREEYEICAEIKKQIDEVNKELGEL
jgi:protein-arginine kinase activator protein McsA